MAIQRPGAAGDGDRLDLQANLGRFLLVWPIEKVESIETTFGAKDAIRANIVVLDDPAGPAKYDDALLFGMVLIGQLKRYVGAAYDSPVVGRLVQGTGKVGQKPPWQLDDNFGDAEVKLAEAYIAANPIGRLQSPAAATPPAPPRAPLAAVPTATTTGAASPQPAPFTAPPPPPAVAPPTRTMLSVDEVIAYMAAGWPDGQLAALETAPPMAALAAIRAQATAAGRLVA